MINPRFMREQAMRSVALEVTDLQYSRFPELEQRYGPEGKAKCLEDAVYHLSYLTTAAAVDDDSLFIDYVGWAKIMLAARGIPPDDLIAMLELFGEPLGRLEDQALAARILLCLEGAIAAFPTLSASAPSQIVESSTLHESAERYVAHLLAGQRNDAEVLAEELLQAGASIEDLYLGLFEPAQHEIGRLWQLNRVSVAQEHFCTAGTQAIMSRLYARIFTGRSSPRRIIAACAGSELHQVGLRMVSDVLEIHGWDVMYLGASVPATSLVPMVARHRPALIALSATIAVHLPLVTEIIALLRADLDLCDIPILVGGYPFSLSPSLAVKLGADGYGKNVVDALQQVNRLAS